MRKITDKDSHASLPRTSAAPVEWAASETGRSAGARSGEFVLLEGGLWYRIRDYDRLEPFLINLATDTDLWMFVASSGGLTAGRADADGSLFPYVTSDQLYDAHRHTGPITLLRVERKGQPPILWTPFEENAPTGSRMKAGEAPIPDPRPHVDRNLYKNVSGNQIIFEETAPEFGLTFRHRWAGCDTFGWVRTATLENRGRTTARIVLLDGLRNVLPWGAPLGLYQQAGNLVDAYKQSEIDPATGLGIFALTAGITDRPEALEILRANTVWCGGLDSFRPHLSLGSIQAFKGGRPFPGRLVSRGKRGNYLVSATLELAPGETARWHIVADAGLDHLRIQDLRRVLLSRTNLVELVDRNIQEADANLNRIVASADGLQLTGQTASWSHHFANVLFNSMRGGVFLHNNDVPVEDFARIVRLRHREAADRRHSQLAAWPEWMTVSELRKAARDTADPDFARLAHEYLPLYFGRRHGDPSRPWNQFEIRVRDRHGQRVLHHEGNWRDIFQNWEALAASFPSYLPNMVARFVSASTVDGFNPYRITQEGVEWEVPSPADPWSNIGYWGDHQIVYLQRLLEALGRYDPAALSAMLGEDIFSYADVPYRIKPYEEILRNPRITIDYDTEHAKKIDARVQSKGTDGRLLPSADGSVYHVNLFEKLLVPALARLSNLIPGAGIWMNTQRPEWNDANNALAGGSVSVVTLCHLRRYLAFLVSKLEEACGPACPAQMGHTARAASAVPGELPVSAEVAQWFERVSAVLAGTSPAGGPFTATRGCRDALCRKQVMDALGRAFSEYRAGVYSRGLSGRKPLSVSRVVRMCRTALAWVDASIGANRREDGLYHTYNQLSFTADDRGVEVVRLQEMLEGQVAVLSSGAIAPAEALQVLERMFSSALYRTDQKSFMLYPQRERPGFMARNRIPDEAIDSIPLMGEMESRGNESLWARDASGTGRFHGDIRNARDVEAILAELAKQDEWADVVTKDRAAVLELFETVFEHRSYTGRSAVMYGYEGIGCIYWHMVAKLLLAVQENLAEAARQAVPQDTRQDTWQDTRQDTPQDTRQDTWQDTRQDTPQDTRQAARQDTRQDTRQDVLRGLARLYGRVQAGLGYRKTPSEYGAFPTDPYSHTPYSGGAKQPGMTGQVKEEILTRLGELGVSVEAGALRFRPLFLPPSEFLESPAEFHYYDVDGHRQTVPIPEGGLAFTFCQVPVLYRRTKGRPGVQVVFADGSSHRRAGTTLGADLARELFERTGRIHHLEVEIPESDLLPDAEAPGSDLLHD